MKRIHNALFGTPPLVGAGADGLARADPGVVAAVHHLHIREAVCAAALSGFEEYTQRERLRLQSTRSAAPISACPPSPQLTRIGALLSLSFGWQSPPAGMASLMAGGSAGSAKSGSARAQRSASEQAERRGSREWSRTDTHQP